MLQLAAMLLLLFGATLEVSGAGFFGLDLLIGLCFTAAVVLAAASALGGRSLVLGLLTATLSALALALHVSLNFGWL
jgi:hypothetical protein